MVYRAPSLTPGESVSPETSLDPVRADTLPVSPPVLVVGGVVGGGIVGASSSQPCIEFCGIIALWGSCV
jgi:hypothetical protein